MSTRTVTSEPSTTVNSGPEPKNSNKIDQRSNSKSSTVARSNTMEHSTPSPEQDAHHQHHHHHHHHHHHKQRKPRPLWPSLLAGATQAVLFNPIDRALYLRVHNRERHLFARSNWSHPFQGFTNAAVYRTISGATYLFFQDSFNYMFQTAKPAWFAAPSELLDNNNNSYNNKSNDNNDNSNCDEDQVSQRLIAKRNLYLLQLSVGTCAGAANGMCLNWFQLIKFRLWSEGTNAGFFTTARHIYDVGGFKMFFRGAGVSVMRDLSFGVAYEVLRAPGLEIAAEMKKKRELLEEQELLLSRDSSSGGSSGDRDRDGGQHHKHHSSDHAEFYQFAYNASAGALASMVSSPFNYCRNLMYGSPTSSSPLRVSSMIEFLLRECVAHRQPMAHLNARLNLGWGTVRVGVGIASGQAVYSWVNRIMEGNEKMRRS